MDVSRPKLTRRRGACKGCRQKKIRCDGRNPCSHCERSASSCEYLHAYRSRRYHQEKNTRDREPQISRKDMVAGSSNQNDPLEAALSQITQSLADPTAAPPGGCFSQPVSENTPSFLGFDFPDTTILDVNMTEDIEKNQRAFDRLDQGPYANSEKNAPLLEFLDWNYDQISSPSHTAKSDDFVEIEPDLRTRGSTLALLTARMAVGNKEVQPFLGPKTHRITAFLQQVNLGSSRQHAAAEKIKRLLSPERRICLSDLLCKADHDGEHRGVDLNHLPMKRLIQKAFQEPLGLSMFIREQDVTCVQERFLHQERPLIDVSDMSMLVITLTWGALLDPEIDPSVPASLVDTIPGISKLLLRQNDSVRKFLALVAALCLTEKTGLHNLPALVLGTTSTVASLSLHLEPIARSFCVTDEQAAQTKRAMSVLYCIDKAYALRWQTFPIFGNSSLPTTNPSEDVLQSDVAFASPSYCLRMRLRYSKICLDVLQLRGSLEQPASKDDRRIAELSTALSEWYDSVKTDQKTSSLEPGATMRFKHRVFCNYHEALFELESMSLLHSRSSTSAFSRGHKDSLKLPIREVITFFSTMSSEDLLQAHDCIYLSTLALCLLSLTIIFEAEKECNREDRALLSIACGFFARIGIASPRSSVFGEVSSLVDILTYH